MLRSSSSSSTNNSYDVERFLKERRSITSISKRFKETYGIDYNSDPKKVKRAEYLLSKRYILDWIDHAGITYLSRLHRELEDAGNDIAKSTLSDYLEATIDDGLLDFYCWYPLSKNYKYHKFIISPSCSKEKIERVLKHNNEKDMYYYNKSLNKKEEARKKAKIDQMKGTIASYRSQITDLSKHKEKCGQCYRYLRDNKGSHCQQYLIINHGNNELRDKIVKIQHKLDTL
jgi:hypothetical protein